MRRILAVILTSIVVALALCACLVVKRLLFQGRVEAMEVGLLFVCAIAAFWILALKEWKQSKGTRQERELDDLVSVDDELVRLVRQNAAFSFKKRSVAGGNTAVDYAWVIQAKTFDFNFAIAKAKVRPGRLLDELTLGRQLKADLKRTCGGWFMKPLVLGIVLETNTTPGWQASLYIDRNYAGGVGIAWLILLDQGAKQLSQAHYPRPLGTTVFYDQFVSALIAKGYETSVGSTGAVS